jgi:hypothetical protein
MNDASTFRTRDVVVVVEKLLSHTYRTLFVIVLTAAAVGKRQKSSTDGSPLTHTIYLLLSSVKSSPLLLEPQRCNCYSSLIAVVANVTLCGSSLSRSGE